LRVASRPLARRTLRGRIPCPTGLQSASRSTAHLPDRAALGNLLENSLVLLRINHVDITAQDPYSAQNSRRLHARRNPHPGAKPLAATGRNGPSPSPASDRFDSRKGLDDASRPQKLCDGSEVKHFQGHTGGWWFVDFTKAPRVVPFVPSDETTACGLHLRQLLRRGAE
jgi:hypothetical protein